MLRLGPDERPILLTRLDGRCFAVGAACPHAGAPLETGVLRGGQVICPWHKAVFDVRTGALCDPPAVDALPRYEVEESGGVIRIGAELPQPATSGSPIRPDDGAGMLIIGSGGAAMLAAQSLREEGFAGAIRMVSPETILPYDRTVLSKYILSGQQAGEKTPLHDEAFFQQAGIERIAGRVSELDVEGRQARLEDGRALPYQACLVATGAEPRRLPIPGADLPGVHLLRRPEDAAAIVGTAQSARHAVVAGGGFIAMEAAAALRERGLEVTVVCPEVEPLMRPLGQEVGRVFRTLHEEHGVSFILDAKLQACGGETKVAHVTLDDGRRLETELVVIGAGVTPATNFVPAAYRREDKGIVVDSQLRMHGEVFAAGDVAAFPLYGEGELVRVEHWRVAQQQGRVAAANMLGCGRAYVAAPVFWTIQYMERLDLVGHAAGWDDIVLQGNVASRNFLAFYLKAGQVIALAGWGRDRQMAAAVSLMRKLPAWSLDALSAELDHWA